MVARPGNAVATLIGVVPPTPFEGLTIDALAARCEHYRQRSEALFEVAGRWSAIAQSDAERLVLARVATHWSSHAELWAERLPAPGFVSVATETVQAVAIRAVAENGPTALGLQGLYELVAQLTDELGQWLARHDPDVDAPTVRVLELVVADLRRDLDDLVGRAGEP